jgi:hypothetical protein
MYTHHEYTLHFTTHTHTLYRVHSSEDLTSSLRMLVRNGATSAFVTFKDLRKDGGVQFLCQVDIVCTNIPLEQLREYQSVIRSVSGHPQDEAGDTKVVLHAIDRLTERDIKTQLEQLQADLAEQEARVNKLPKVIGIEIQENSNPFFEEKEEKPQPSGSRSPSPTSGRSSLGNSRRGSRRGSTVRSRRSSLARRKKPVVEIVEEAEPEPVDPFASHIAQSHILLKAVYPLPKCSAYQAGMRHGDYVLAVNGVHVNRKVDFSEIVKAAVVGDVLTMDVYRPVWRDAFIVHCVVCMHSPAINAFDLCVCVYHLLIPHKLDTHTNTHTHTFRPRNSPKTRNGMAYTRPDPI